MREALTEVVAETSDDLIEKYLDEGEISAAEIEAGFATAVGAGNHLPGDRRLGDAISASTCCSTCSSWLLLPARRGADARGRRRQVELVCDAGKPAAAFVFKTVADPFSGHINVFRVFQGTVTGDSQVDGRP